MNYYLSLLTKLINLNKCIVLLAICLTSRFDGCFAQNISFYGYLNYNFADNVCVENHIQAAFGSKVNFDNNYRSTNLGGIMEFKKVGLELMYGFKNLSAESPDFDFLLSTNSYLTNLTYRWFERNYLIVRSAMGINFDRLNLQSKSKLSPPPFQYNITSNILFSGVIGTDVIYAANKVNHVSGALFGIRALYYFPIGSSDWSDNIPSTPTNNAAKFSIGLIGGFYF